MSDNTVSIRFTTIFLFISNVQTVSNVVEGQINHRKLNATVTGFVCGGMDEGSYLQDGGIREQ